MITFLLTCAGLALLAIILFVVGLVILNDVLNSDRNDPFS